MGLIELLLIAVGLSMDAFSVAICKGLSMKKINRKHMYFIAFAFGGFQALMPLIGWFLGKQFESYITAIDHWIAFFLLLIIGGKMILDAIKENNEEDHEKACCAKFDVKEVLVMAVATSIDALAVGITFAFLKVDILLSVVLIGVVTFGLALIGVMIGNQIGGKCKNKATLFGGIVLILIGTKILLEHLGILF